MSFPVLFSNSLAHGKCSNLFLRNRIASLPSSAVAQYQENSMQIRWRETVIVLSSDCSRDEAVVVVVKLLLQSCLPRILSSSVLWPFTFLMCHYYNNNNHYSSSNFSSFLGLPSIAKRNKRRKIPFFVCTVYIIPNHTK